jgi:hypothetical protein
MQDAHERSILRRLATTAPSDHAGNLTQLFGFGEFEVRMAEQNSTAKSGRSEPSGEQLRRDEDENPQQHDVEIPAIRHIGPTIESAEAQGDAGIAEAVNLLRDAGGTSIYEPGPDAPRVNTGPEPLRTRLPGDTSSEPHTDVGPDNATVVQHRGEKPKR